MDLILDLLATVSRWSRGYLPEVSPAVMATLLVLFGPALNVRLQRLIGNLNFVLRTLLFVLACLLIYGLAIIYLSPLLAQGLSYFNNYSLAPVLLLLFFLIGLLADRN